MNAGRELRTALIPAAWVVMLVVSDLPDILITMLGGAIPSWVLWAKAGFLASFLVLCLTWRAIRPLWQYAAVFLVLLLSLSLTGLIRTTDWFQSRFNYVGVSFFTGYAAVFVLDIIVALVVLTVLWLMKRDRRAFFLVKGQVNAPIEPVRWLGIRAGESWRTFGWIFAAVAALAVAIPTILGIAPSSEVFLRALPLLPVALLLAAVNAFTEEAYFRCSLLSTLHEIIGKTHTLLLTVVYFGLAHWLHGSPPGLLGFLMVGFLAWLLGKAMLETRGFLWPWCIHFLPDAVIFFSYALLYVRS
ncbi:CPBP family intramembrane metalloprotease [Candidatus Fermentibacteria bacterium]|nr:CPBP family intramembrane metalloprotease [Candidatus Fermentibacteria bacterium]